MTYVDGFLVAVPTANKEQYREHAEAALPMFKGYGATRMVEGWGDDVPRGEVNDLYGAVQARDDETVLFSWIEYPDKATRDAAYKRMEADPAMKDMADMPFDGKRMIWSGFEMLHEEGSGGKPGYVDGVVLPVPRDKKEAYRDFCRTVDAAFREQGATRIVDGWGDDLMVGKQTDFHRATHRKDDETVVFSWIEWPDKATRDAAWEQLMKDERMANHDRPFDGKRMMFGGFVPVVDA
ncbi:DUF1428 domain-containing protein [Sphingomonas aestuarii]